MLSVFTWKIHEKFYLSNSTSQAQKDLSLKSTSLLQRFFVTTKNKCKKRSYYCLALIYKYNESISNRGTIVSGCDVIKTMQVGELKREMVRTSGTYGKQSLQRTFRDKLWSAFDSVAPVEWWRDEEKKKRRRRRKEKRWIEARCRYDPRMKVRESYRKGGSLLSACTSCTYSRMNY